MGEFACETKKLKDMSAQAYEDFMQRDPNTFCKSHFKTHSKCDSVDNNMAETFNSFILLARYKPIISMLEDIRLALMDRMQQKYKLLEKFSGRGIAPRVEKKLQEAYNEQTLCQVHWNGGNDQETGFEVRHRGHSHDVNLANRTCTCRVWDLTGIPCAHVIAAILFMRRKVEDYVSDYYTKDTYLMCYSKLLNPVEGSKFWDMEGEGMVLPPNIVKRKIGRPKTSRRRDSDEPTRRINKASRAGVPTKCSNCGESGHTRKNCPHPKQTTHQVPQSQTTDGGSTSNAGSTSQTRNKGGRPRGRKNKIGQTQDELTTNNVPIPASIIIERRAMRTKTRREARAESAPETNARGRGRGRGRSRGRGHGHEGGSRARGSGGDSGIDMPEGYGLWQSEHGDIAFRGSTQAPPIFFGPSTQNDSQLLD